MVGRKAVISWRLVCFEGSSKEHDDDDEGNDEDDGRHSRYLPLYYVRKYKASMRPRTRIGSWVHTFEVIFKS